MSEEWPDVSYRFSPAQRQKCWEKYFGDSDRGFCWVCNCHVSRESYLYNTFHAGHKVAQARGGSDHPLRNCIVLCPHHNESMGEEHPRAYLHHALHPSDARQQENYLRRIGFW